MRSSFAQDSFADAYLSRDCCRGDCEDPAVFGRWLRGVARNKFRYEMRSRKRRQQRVAPVDPSNLEAAAERPQVQDGRNSGVCEQLSKSFQSSSDKLS